MTGCHANQAVPGFVTQRNNIVSSLLPACVCVCACACVCVCVLNLTPPPPPFHASTECRVKGQKIFNLACPRRVFRMPVGMSWIIRIMCEFLFFVSRVLELCESWGGRPGLPVLMSLMVYVDVGQH